MYCMSRDSSVGIATGYGLDDRMIGGWEFFSRHHVQPSSGAHPDSYPMGTGALSLEVKRPGRETNHSPPSSAEVKNAWNYPFTSQYAFRA
jgi:hypothetical protein